MTGYKFKVLEPVRFLRKDQFKYEDLKTAMQIDAPHHKSIYKSHWKY